MTRDPGLEDLLREALLGRLPPDADLRDRPMFGGLCTMLNGNMLAGTRTGRLMLRTGKPAEAEALAIPGVIAMDHGGRRMAGYVWAVETAYGDDATLGRLLDMAITNAATLPPK